MKRLEEIGAYLTNEHENPDAFEEAMFDAPDDADLAWFDVFARHGARLASHHTFDIGCLREDVEALVAAGLRVQVEERWPGTTRMDLADDAEIFCTKLHIGRTDLERVDVEITLMNAQKTIRDVLVDQREGTIYGLCERPLAKIAYGAGRSHIKVRERGGERRVIVEYTFNEHLS